MDQFQPFDVDLPTTVLTDEELDEFFNDLDHNHDGFVTFSELESKLDQVYNELVPNRRAEDAPSDHKIDCEKGLDLAQERRHMILEALFPKHEQRIDRQKFVDYVRTWYIPSQHQTTREQEDAEHNAFEKRLSRRRALRLRWMVQGPKTLFVMFVILLQIAFGTWQGVEFIYDSRVRAAMGWGVVIAKFCAGALYPTLFLLILSMSRLFATFMRRYYWTSRIVDWDRNKSFHIWMAATSLVLGTIHGTSHLTGSFVAGSLPSRQLAMAEMLGGTIPSHANDTQGVEGCRSYVSFLTSIPAITGIIALACFWIMALLSMSVTRRRLPYEVFQCAHLLMFPIMGLLSIHGVTRLLGPYPMLGFWLVMPGCLVIYERSLRVLRCFFWRAPTLIRTLDGDTVSLTCTHPKGKPWRYSVGQYVLIQVPLISLFQWHPFTVSACSGHKLQLHIKTTGDWTRKLRSLPMVCQVGIDGPFGAPSQRFYEFNRSIIIGSGVGITPFSAIVADLVQHANRNVDPWSVSRRSSRQSHQSDTSSGSSTLRSELQLSDSSSGSPMPSNDNQSPVSSTIGSTGSRKSIYTGERRVDFHWIVREENHLSWFSSLLNYAHSTFAFGNTANLHLNINTYVTVRRENISTHVFRYLLDAYRTPLDPLSALTGLKVRTVFQRPHLQGIMSRFHQDLREKGIQRERIGVFFCGNPQLGSVLADLCAQLTLQARRDGSCLIYVFIVEVFE